MTTNQHYCATCQGEAITHITVADYEPDSDRLVWVCSDHIDRYL